MANSKMTAVNGGSLIAESDIGLLTNNLVDALTAEFVFLCQVREAQPTLMIRTDAGIAGRVGCRPRAKRAPLPTRDCLEHLHPLNREAVDLVALAGIANETPQLDFNPFEDFDVNCRDSAVAFSRAELLKGCQIHVESHAVVHGAYNSRKILDGQES